MTRTTWHITFRSESWRRKKKLVMERLIASLTIHMPRRLLSGLGDQMFLLDQMLVWRIQVTQCPITLNPSLNEITSTFPLMHSLLVSLLILLWGWKRTLWTTSWRGILRPLQTTLPPTTPTLTAQTDKLSCLQLRKSHQSKIRNSIALPFYPLKRIRLGRLGWEFWNERELSSAPNGWKKVR